MANTTRDYDPNSPQNMEAREARLAAARAQDNPGPAFSMAEAERITRLTGNDGIRFLELKADTKGDRLAFAKRWGEETNLTGPEAAREIMEVERALADDDKALALIERRFFTCYGYLTTGRVHWDIHEGDKAIESAPFAFSGVVTKTVIVPRAETDKRKFVFAELASFLNVNDVRLVWVMV